jgi:transcriptional regulator with XRE-family HTH domain
MAELNSHWTEASIEDFLYRVGSDYITQIEQAMDAEGTKQSELAKALNVTEGRVSQVLNNPGNLTLRKIIEYARALKKKVAIVAYDDQDPENRNGPINSQIFARCWETVGRPTDFFAPGDRQIVSTTASLGQCVVHIEYLAAPRHANLVLMGSGANTSFQYVPHDDFSSFGETGNFEERSLWQNPLR